MTHHRYDSVAMWETDQLAQGLSGRTISERLSIVDRLGTGTGQDPADLDTRQVLNWIAAHRGRWSVSTLATYDGYLRAWFQWLQDQGIRSDHPMSRARRPKTPKRKARPVTDAHVTALLSLRMKTNTRAQCLLAAFAGMRVHEIAKIQSSDVDAIGGWIHIVGKGAVSQSVPLHPLLADLAEQMPRGYWFVSDYGNGAHGAKGTAHILARSVSTNVSTAMKRAGIHGGTAHQLRHWYGTSLVENGANMAQAQQALRHSTIATTQLYVQVNQRALQDAVNRLHIA
jgi:integrase/recombinase XerD